MSSAATPLSFLHQTGAKNSSELPVSQWKHLLLRSTPLIGCPLCLGSVFCPATESDILACSVDLFPLGTGERPLFDWLGCWHDKKGPAYIDVSIGAQRMWCVSWNVLRLFGTLCNIWNLCYFVDLVVVCVNIAQYCSVYVLLLSESCWQRGAHWSPLSCRSNARRADG